jgi:hypothetical protein
MNQKVFTMNRFRVFGILLLLLVFTMCGRNKSGQQVEQATVANKFDVLEVLQTPQYTYLQVLEGLEVRWVAIPQQEAKIGDSFFYDSALEMRNFQSKELDRTFELIYFVNRVSNAPLDAAHQSGAMQPHSGRVPESSGSSVVLQKADNEITVAQIFENRNGFSGKEVEIRGIVVKINEGIMGTNWIHLQDGTSHNGSFDLTITSDDLPSLNSEATFRGTITLNKDFGSGYFYDIIMESAALK